jgi:hypothetical protein
MKFTWNNPFLIFILAIKCLKRKNTLSFVIALETKCIGIIIIKLEKSLHTEKFFKCLMKLKKAQINKKSSYVYISEDLIL